MADSEFIVETAEPNSIRVRHLQTAARFFFVIEKKRITVVLGSNERNPMELTVRNRARSFATKEARARGLID